jgi:hypothetical protein
MESQLLQFRQRFKDMLQGRQDRVDERLDVVVCDLFAFLLLIV